MKKTIFLFTALLLHASLLFSQTIKRVDPTNWWVGMKNPKLQLLLYGKDLKGSKVAIKHKGIKIEKVHEVENPNYLFVDVLIAPTTKAGRFDIEVSKNTTVKFAYELKTRDKKPQTINAQDFIYLVLPDRFANADPSNDKFADMADTAADRNNPFLRHGGDLKGIENHLDYLSELGVTTLWLNPVIENNQPQTQEGNAMRSAYHGYGFTDHYHVDRRLGGNAAYKSLIDAAHAKGIKIMQDAVYNHVGINHWILNDLPMKSWLNQWDTYTNTSYRDEPLVDMTNGNKMDFNVQQNGWFVPFLPDLNHKNHFVATYLIQHALWTVEYFGIDGWRIDTYQYNDLAFMNACNGALLREYPNMYLTGENSVQNIVSQAFFVRNKLNIGFKSNLPSPNDFVLYYAINAALNEKFDWGKGFNRVYTVLSNDLIYENPSLNMTFLDNHDQDRYFSVIGESMEKYKLGLTLLLTTRGTPHLYYGTEILMKNFKDPSDAEVRRDFPGGFANDPSNKFLAANRTEKENEAFNFVKLLANYRKNCSALQTGKLTQYLPQDGVYTYFRHDAQKTVMVILSQSDKEKTLEVKRFAENLTSFTKGKNILTNQDISVKDNITVKPMSVMVLELSK